MNSIQRQDPRGMYITSPVGYTLGATCLATGLIIQGFAANFFMQGSAIKAESYEMSKSLVAPMLSFAGAFASLPLTVLGYTLCKASSSSVPSYFAEYHNFYENGKKTIANMMNQKGSCMGFLKNPRLVEICEKAIAKLDTNEIAHLALAKQAVETRLNQTAVESIETLGPKIQAYIQEVIGQTKNEVSACLK